MEEIKPKYWGLGVSAFLGVVFLIISGLLIRSGFKFISPIIDFTGYFIILVGMVSTILVLQELSILFQFYSIERGRKVFLDPTGKRLIVRDKKSQDEVIEFKDVQRIVINNRMSNLSTTSLSRGLEYAQIYYGLHKTLIITSLRMDNESVRKTFSKVENILSKDRKPLSRIKVH